MSGKPWRKLKKRRNLRFPVRKICLAILILELGYGIRQLMEEPAGLVISRMETETEDGQSEPGDGFIRIYYE